MREVEISYEGNEVRAKEMDFTTVSESWGEYTTEDGVRIKMRSVVARIYRLLDKTKDDGSMIHVLHGSVVLDTVLPSSSETVAPDVAP